LRAGETINSLAMPVLVDGYNLLHATREYEEAADWGRQQLCRLLIEWAQRKREEVVVVFDGVAPRGALGEQLHGKGIGVIYSGAGRSADALIAQMIEASSAPRRLLVVSSDRQVQRAARRRRCRHVGSPVFFTGVVRALSTRRASAAEPAEKREGTAPQDVDRWLRQFGYDGKDEPDEFPEIQAAAEDDTD
jgi:predicted RNA-binding protein with PIN domain